MRAMRQGWSLRKVRRTWAQGKMGKVILLIGWIGLLWILAASTGVQAASDTQPPVITISIPDDSLWLKQITPQITVRDDHDPNPTTEIYLDGKPYKAGTMIREPGLHELQVIARDASGNASEEVIYFQILEEPHYLATLSLVQWSWWEEGDYAGFDAWFILHGPFVPDRRMKSLGAYPEEIPVCTVKPLHFLLLILDKEDKPLTVDKLILPQEIKECPEEPASTPCKSVYYDRAQDKVALHFRVVPSERLLHRGVPKIIKIVGIGTVWEGEFTFESAVSSTPDSTLQETLTAIISRGDCRPCVLSATSRRCECKWQSFPAHKDSPDIDADTRLRRCAISPGWTEEKYRIHARPSRIDGWGYAFDMCEAQNAMIPTPGHRGVVTSGLKATPALVHIGPCCCQNGPEITLNGDIAFGVTVRTRGDARSQIAGVIRVANNIADIQAAGGLSLGSGGTSGTVQIGPVTVPLIVPSGNPGTQLFFDNKVVTRNASSVWVNCLTGIWISMGANGYPLHAEAQADLYMKKKSVTFFGICSDCGHSGRWTLP